MVLGGLAAGMVLFTVSVGLSVTMGLMGFVNLAHGGFAMAGAYVAIYAVRAELGFVAALALAFLAAAALALLLERLLYARLYGAPELDQVLFSIGLVFVMIAAAILVVGPETQTLPLPQWLRGETDLGLIRYRTYSLALLAFGSLLMLALWLGFERTLFGARIRAAVDNRRMALSLGVDVPRLFTTTFAIGSGLAGVGGALGVEILGLDPHYPLRYLPYFLIAVAVGGLGRISGVFYASLAIGVLDFVLKVFFPKGGTLFIYALTLLFLLVRPQGLLGIARA